MRIKQLVSLALLISAVAFGQGVDGISQNAVPISSATLNAIVTAASATSLKTICPTCAIDVNGLIVPAGTLAAPSLRMKDVGGTYGGFYSPAQGNYALAFNGGTTMARWVLNLGVAEQGFCIINVTNCIAGNMDISGGTATATNTRDLPVAVGSLPSCAAGTEGTHAAVINSNAVSFTAGIGSVVAAGGTTHVPVYCDGTNWLIG